MKVLHRRYDDEPTRTTRTAQRRREDAATADDAAATAADQAFDADADAPAQPVDGTRGPHVRDLAAIGVGLILAGTPSAPRSRRLVHPLRDAFAAIFFLAFGPAIDPGDFAVVLVPVAVAVTLTVVMDVAAGRIAARPYGQAVRPAAARRAVVSAGCEAAGHGRG